MKTFLLILIVSQFGFSVAHGSGSGCSAKENVATEYRQWKKSFHKFLSEYDGLNSSERFTTSQSSLKDILVKMQTFSEKTLIPMPETTVIHAKGLMTEIEAGRMARTTALPILKSSLKKLEDSMDEMVAKAQWKNPTCDLDSGNSKSAELSKSTFR